MSDLAFYTCDELIEELLSRRTFLGIVIRSDEELTTDEVLPTGFQMACRNVTPEQAVDILGHIGGCLKEDLDNGDGPEWHSEN
jgi:hypothetical protein